MHSDYLSCISVSAFQNKVNLVTLSAGAYSSSLQKMKQVTLDMRFGGWVAFDLEELPGSKKVMTIDVKGPDSHLRVRQIKVLGVRDGEQFPGMQISKSFYSLMMLWYFPKFVGKKRW